MFEVETSTRIICCEKDCEVLIMTGENEYHEVSGSIGDYDGMDFDWLNLGKVRSVELPPMLCS